MMEVLLAARQPIDFFFLAFEVDESCMMTMTNEDEAPRAVTSTANGRRLWWCKLPPRSQSQLSPKD